MPREFPTAAESDLNARRGERVFPAWRALLEWIRSTGIITGPGVTVTQNAFGTEVRADHFQLPFLHPFKVSVMQGGGFFDVNVREGTVNALSPFLGTTRGSLPLDGIDPDEEDSDLEGVVQTVPPLIITAPKDGETVTYITLNVKPDLETGEIVQGRDTLWISHELDQPTQGIGGSLDDAGLGQFPIARLKWGDTDQFLGVNDVVHHNQGYEYAEEAPELGRPARHIFWAV